MAHSRRRNRQPTLTLTLGLPGSGKSTWAKQVIDQAPAGSVVRVNKDDLRALLHNGRFAGKVTEAQVEEARDTLVVNALLAGVDVIVDDTNGAPRHEARLRQLAALYGARFEVRSFLDVGLNECIRRDSLRTGPARVGEEVVRKVHQQFRHRRDAARPLLPQPYQAPPGAPTCTIFDVDGTLALMGRRNPFDESRVGEDMPNEPIVDLAKMLLDSGETVIVFSGRSDGCFEQTQDWLDKHLERRVPLFMRATGDERQDFLVKYDLFQEHVAGKYRVRMVFDDRDQVILLWRRVLALPTLQVAEGRF